MASSPFPNRPFQLRENVWLITQDGPTIRSLVGWELWIDKTGYSPTQSGQGLADRNMFLNGQLAGESYVRGFNFTDNGPWLILNGQTWVQHNPDGTLNLPIQGNANYDILGATTVNNTLQLPPIAVYGPPNPTVNGRLSLITKSSMLYNFAFGGGVVFGYDVRYATNAAYTGAVQIPGADGNVPLTGLKSGTKYWVQSRAYNDKGASAWGAEATATTLSGAQISDGTTWLQAEVFISNGTQWLPADVLISNGTSWAPSG